MPFLGNLAIRYRCLNKGGTGTHRQNQSGIDTKTKWYRYPLTGTDQSGTDTDASGSPDCCTLALLTPKFVHR